MEAKLADNTVLSPTATKTPKPGAIGSERNPPLFRRSRIRNVCLDDVSGPDERFEISIATCGVSLAVKVTDAIGHQRAPGNRHQFLAPGVVLVQITAQQLSLIGPWHGRVEAGHIEEVDP